MTTTEFQRGEFVIVEPVDDDDPLANEWTGRKVQVQVHAISNMYNYVRVKDANGYKATFRPRDLRRVNA